ncbi:MAG: RNA 2',3'-cyclic phosphodiesterase [Candidatus Omnitrophica bacterium]|nr:RNA 2',3'-cyclic phosphodiesterase [Candidatus Omnitrophota bacterium]MCM8776789.1 RNA 2',3'-cyclic phosphodiesterase [Candidatus Omnitrophota bacterium]
MRLFIGIRIPDEIKKKIEETVVSDIRKKIREARIIPSENLHLTLKFIGETSENNIPYIEKIISSSVENFLPIKAIIKGTGVFPDNKSARVFWIGMDSQGTLKKLNNIIETELDKTGISKKEGRFKEHITIARFKSVPKLSSLGEILERYSDEVFGTMDIIEIELIKSDLKSSGAMYTTIFKTPRK